MAAQPREVIWSAEAAEQFRLVAPREATDIIERIQLVSSFPRMCRIELFGRWAGLRRFFSGRWVVFYSAWQGDSQLFIEAILSATADFRTSDE